MDAKEFDAFDKLIAALRPRLGQVVVVGGWAHRLHRLHRLHPSAQRLDYAPLMTLDTDIAVPRDLPAKAESIRDRLPANGFEEEFLGDHRPPVTHYRLKGEATGFYAEFLTPLVGGRYDRGHRRMATTEVSGVTSQTLRYIELLLVEPWPVERNGVEILVANPASFLAQKILIHEKRSADERAKDILYLHDTLEMFGYRLEDLHEHWETRVSPQLAGKLPERVRATAGSMFKETSDAMRKAATIAIGRSLSAARIRDACDLGLKEVFSRRS